MGPFALLGLLGFSFLFALTSGEDTPADEPQDETPVDPVEPPVDPVDPVDPPVDPVNPPAEPGTVLPLEGQATVNGTAGDDTLVADTQDAGARNITEINMGDGDDLVDIDLPFGLTADGEAGNDTIISAGYTNTLNGGEGDDVLVGGPADNMNGGEGNDRLSVSLIEIYDGSGVLDGGAGEDTISVTTDFGYGKSDFPSAGITGGAGADTVELTLQMTDGPFDDDIARDTNTSVGIGLNDFDAAEDSLVIQIERDEANADREMTSAEIVTTESEFRGETFTRTDLVMTFAATETHGAHTATIGLGDDVNLTIDDVVFIQS